VGKVTRARVGINCGRQELELEEGG